MSRQPRTHYANHSEGDLAQGLCGILAALATRDVAEVTCRMCLKRLAELPFAPAELTEVEPWTPPPAMAARIGARNLTPADQRAIDESRSGSKVRPEFRSMGDALTQWATVFVDGYAQSSASAGCERLGIVGAMIQTSGRGTTATIRQADVVVQVGLMLDHVFSSWAAEHADHALSAKDARSCWLSMEVGLPMSITTQLRSGEREWTVTEDRAWNPLKASEIAAETGLRVAVLGNLRKWARRRMTVEMVARGLLAEPLRPVTCESEERAEQRVARWRRGMRAIDNRRNQLKDRL